MTLNLPLDFERLPEFWQLKEALRAAWWEANANRPTPLAEVADSEINDMAVLLWMRLWVVLGYLARATNRSGWLNAAGERQLNHSFRKFGEDCPPVSILVAGTVLKKVEDGERPAGAPGRQEGYFCDLFATTNRHLAGNYLTKEEKGNRRSLPGRSKNVIAQEAMQQAQLLAEEVFHKRDGTLMDRRLVDRSMILIITLDRCLKLRQRFQSTFTAGLVADACHILETAKTELLPRFYEWLAERYDHPATPKSAEEILRDWDRLFKTFEEMEG